MKKNQVYQGDCVELLRQCDEGSVDLVFADPPFNIGYDYDVYDDTKQSQDYVDWCREWINGVHRALKSDGTFWLAIGDEFAAELKIEAQKAGFHCRSWVIWYYTFGVNCVNGFSRSHTHLFHFVKDPKKFTFNRSNPQIRVPSARQLVYADNRANPNGRLPDNTWIYRPQDAPMSFSPSHDTWYFARVAGTFKEREGFHGCQMPEQLLARVIRSSSRPQELVLDPFGGSGTTMCVAKKLGRDWMGFELSEEYVKYIDQRLAKTNPGDGIDGPEDPISSVPTTANGKRKAKPFGRDVDRAVVDAYQSAGLGFPADYLLCDSELNQEFISQCMSNGIRGSAAIWNHHLLALRKAGKLPRSTRKVPRISAEAMNRYSYASEVAWRLLAIDYQKTLDEIMCTPEFAAEFDRLAAQFGPADGSVSALEYRRAAFSIRKRTKPARTSAAEQFKNGLRKGLRRTAIEDIDEKLEIPGVFALMHDGVGIHAYESNNIAAHVRSIMEIPYWQELQPESVLYSKNSDSFETKYVLKSALVRSQKPLLNCRLWVDDSELPLPA